MNPQEQQTLYETIKARFERNEEGSITWVEDQHGLWEIQQPRIDGKMVRYFTPQYQEGIDKYGFINNKKNNKMSKGAIMITLVIAGIGIGILGWAMAESVRVAEIKPQAQSIHVANIWMWVGIGGGGLIATGLALLAAGWGRGK